MLVCSCCDDKGTQLADTGTAAVVGVTEEDSREVCSLRRQAPTAVRHLSWRVTCVCGPVAPGLLCVSLAVSCVAGKAAIEWQPVKQALTRRLAVCPTCGGRRLQKCLNCAGAGLVPKTTIVTR